MFRSLTTGTFVEIKGRWQTSPAKGQSHEIVASAVKIHGPSDPEVRLHVPMWAYACILTYELIDISGAEKVPDK